MPLLEDRAANDGHWAVRLAAVKELARGWKAFPNTLAWLKTVPSTTLTMMCGVLQWRNWRANGTWLKDLAANDVNEWVRQPAVQELARGWNADPDTLPLLKDRAANDDNWEVRQAALQELARGWKDEPDTLPLLKDRAANDDNWAVRQAAVQELVRGWKHEPDVQAFLALPREG